MLLKLAIRLPLALILGGLIGYERERGSRPAGLRTHVLVCVSAALVMLTGEFVYAEYFPDVAPDPLRLGAQVVSGIGFLGAGAIIREGSSVRGLTTAAGLWTVACIGLAVGAGYYTGAVAATVAAYITLVFLHRLENRFAIRAANLGLFIEMRGGGETVSTVEEVLRMHKIDVRKFDSIACGDELLGKYLLRVPDVVSKKRIISALSSLDGVSRVYEDGHKARE